MGKRTNTKMCAHIVFEQNFVCPLFVYIKNSLLNEPFKIRMKIVNSKSGHAQNSYLDFWEENKSRDLAFEPPKSGVSRFWIPFKYQTILLQAQPHLPLESQVHYRGSYGQKQSANQMVCYLNADLNT